jgi:hypothetical protein
MMPDGQPHPGPPAAPGDEHGGRGGMYL